MHSEQSQNTLKHFLLLVLLSAPSLLFAQLGGSTIFNSLNVPSAARIAALGGNAIATVDNDLNLAIYNPSLLDSTMNEQLAMSYVDYFAKTNFGFASYARNVKDVTTVGATIQFFNYGQFDETDSEGNSLGNFYAGDFGATIGASYRVDTNYTVGANVKVLYSTIHSYSSLGAAVDLAGTYQNRKRKFTAALVMKNIGYQFVAYNNDNRENLPFEIQLGITKELKHAPFRFSVIAENLQQWDLTYTNPNDVVQVDPITNEVISDGGFEFGDKLMRHMVFGGELLLSDNFNIRLGYNYRLRQEMKLTNKPGTAGLSWGLGLRIRKFDFSYGRATFHLAGPSNHFTITTNLADWR